MQGRDRYLYLSDNTSHGPGFTQLTARFLYLDDALETSVEEAIAATQGVSRALVVAFSRVYLAGQEEYRSFLRAAYVEAVSAAPFQLHLVRDLPATVIDRLRAEGLGLE